MLFDRFVFEKKALETESGRKIYKLLGEKGLNRKIQSRYTRSDSDDPQKSFIEGKRTLIISTRRVSKFETCKPSADYQLPVFSGCPGMCEYCYLMTRTGEHTYVKLNSDIDNVLEIAKKYINGNSPRNTVFELSASSDPIQFEPFTGMVSEIIEQFAALEHGRLRICTKFAPDSSILNANHGGHTDFRFSINTPNVIKLYEHSTPNFEKRVDAAKKVIEAGYSTGIMIAPVFIYDGWKEDYGSMVDILAERLDGGISTFEAVTHRYTAKAKETITRVFPETNLDMDENNRKFKMGQFGYGKYVYDKEQMQEIKTFLQEKINAKFPSAKLLYVV